MAHMYAHMHTYKLLLATYFNLWMYTRRTETVLKFHTNNNSIAACLQPKVNSLHVPATCNTLAQHQHNDKSIINTPIITPCLVFYEQIEYSQKTGE